MSFKEHFTNIIVYVTFFVNINWWTSFFLYFLQLTTDIDKCKKNKCSKFSTCINLVATYSCRCKKGYIGDGFSCLTGNTMFSSMISLNQIFSPSLNDPDSREYIFLANTIQNGISKAVKASNEFNGFVGTQVTGFSKGSVLADYLLVFSLGESDKVNASKLGDVIYQAIRNDSLLLPNVSVQRFTLASMLPIFICIMHNSLLQKLINNS